MREKRSIRIIKRDSQASEPKAETARPKRPVDSEREMKTVVSGWVKEHARRSDELRKSFAKLLAEVGLQPTRATGRA